MSDLMPYVLDLPRYDRKCEVGILRVGCRIATHCNVVEDKDVGAEGDIETAFGTGMGSVVSD